MFFCCCLVSVGLHDLCWNGRKREPSAGWENRRRSCGLECCSLSGCVWGLTNERSCLFELSGRQRNTSSWDFRGLKSWERWIESGAIRPWRMAAQSILKKCALILRVMLAHAIVGMHSNAVAVSRGFIRTFQVSGGFKFHSYGVANPRYTVGIHCNRTAVFLSFMGVLVGTSMKLKWNLKIQKLQWNFRFKLKLQWNFRFKLKL